MAPRLKVAAVALALLAALHAGSAHAQQPAVRLAAPADCPTNPNCAPGLKKTYAIDAAAALVPLTNPDAGIQALDDGLAELAVAFSSNPGLSRPDIVTLRDDRRMIGSDHITPIVRNALLRRHGARLRNRLNTASALLTTLALRGLNQQVIDGRLPEAVGGEFADANGLGGEPGREPTGPRIVIGHQDFPENETLAYLYAGVLRGAGFRVTVRSVQGLRPQALNKLRSGRIDMFAGYAGSLREYLGRSPLPRALARIGAQPLKSAPAQNRNVFVTKTDTARRLGIAKLSDLARVWSRAVARASAEPMQGEQWALGGGSVLDVPRAWSLSQGEGVTVAVVDTGAKLDHPDLAPNAWTNFREVPGNGADDDNNGYVDDVHGVDLTTKAAAQDLSDGHSHGTHVSGIIAAALNGKGVIGVAPKAKIMVVKVLDARGGGTTGAVAEGIKYAAANGARIINVSIQGDDPDARLNDAVAAAGAANALVVVSAGNSSRDIDARPSYPAAIAADNLVGVAATAPEQGRTLEPASNFGRLNVQVAAPGTDILSTGNDGSYMYKTGTSMAAPMVAGVAALMAAINPRITAPELRGLLMQTSARSQLPVGAGYVDALNASLAASTAVSYGNSQTPQLRILSATVKGKRTQIQAAVLGSRTAITGYRVALDGRAVAKLRAGRSPFTVTLRKASKRVQIDALNAGGGVVTSGAGRVSKLRKGKGGVGGGRTVGAAR